MTDFEPIVDEKGKISGIELTFTTLADKIQNSGRALEQYVNYFAGGIGQGYAYPLIRYLDGEKVVGLDSMRLRNIPVRA
jgi:hypothetical protein